MIAGTKLEMIGSMNGSVVRPVQAEKYYKALYLPVLTANTALPQLDRQNGDKPGYVIARKATGEVIRLSLILISEPTRLRRNSYAGFSLT